VLALMYVSQRINKDERSTHAAMNTPKSITTIAKSNFSRDVIASLSLDFPRKFRTSDEMDRCSCAAECASTSKVRWGAKFQVKSLTRRCRWLVTD